MASAAALATAKWVSDEHGIGLLERQGMQDELGPGAQAMQRAIKATLDPLDLFNPGKVVGDP